MDKRIILIRHGMTPGNLRKAYIGITDEALSVEGENQIKARCYPDADMIFSSPMSRCLQTAEIIYPGRLVQVIEEYKETNFGLFEGKNYQDLSGSPEYQTWIDSGGELPFPSGESKREATVRFISGFEKMLAEARDSRSIVAIVHGGTIMAVLSHLFGGDYYSYMTKNGEGYAFDLSHDGIFCGLCPRSFTR